MNYRILIFSKNEFKIIIIGTVIGGILQVICYKYLKNHPELLNNDNSEKLEPEKPGLRRFVPRGGALLEIAGAKLVINVGALIISVAQKGALAAMLLTTGGVLVRKIPKTSISTFVRNALPVTHSNLEKGYILVNGKKIILNDCDGTFEYMFQVLTSKDIPFESKKEMSLKIIINHVGLETAAGRIRFVFYIISIMHIFVINDISSYFILIENLIKAIKSGKISKRLARLIIRRLLKLNAPVDPELIEAAVYI